MNRRQFLKNTALLAALATCAGTTALSASNRRLDRIGIQLYTLRSLMKDDVASTLQLVADLGYKDVEFAGYFNHAPSDIRHMLDKAGLSTPSTHVELADIRDKLDATIEAAATIGHQYIVMPWLQDHERQSLDQFKGYAELFNIAGEKCRAAGITFAYHNHMFEFDPLDGIEPYELLLAETDTDLVKMELDLFWTIKTGRDPLAYFKRFPGRFPLCHVKDMAANGDMVNVGKGTIDFGSIFRERELAGLKHYFVEHDQPADARISAQESAQALQQLSF